ncbi:MAG: 50S ribosomal protein L23 [Bacteroidota bacterium]|jgi:large subunit ribosomal protein L23|nr:50S ribosomal protein L23 [Bacteroidota bacterium]
MSVLLKPLITEKMSMLTEKRNQYGFVCLRSSTKDEIKAEIEKVYGVEVISISTMVTSPKRKKNRRTGQVTGRTNIYKKAICKLKEGQAIDFYENI